MKQKTIITLGFITPLLIAAGFWLWLYNVKTLTTKVIDQKYSVYRKSANNIYFVKQDGMFRLFEKLDNADLDSFEIVNQYYSKDKNNVYFESKIVEGADLGSFNVGSPEISLNELFRLPANVKIVEHGTQKYDSLQQQKDDKRAYDKNFNYIEDWKMDLPNTEKEITEYFIKQEKEDEKFKAEIEAQEREEERQKAEFKKNNALLWDMTEKEALKLLNYENENPIFQDTNEILKENFPINKDHSENLKEFLEKIELPEIYGLESISGDQINGKELCEKIYKKYLVMYPEQKDEIESTDCLDYIDEKIFTSSIIIFNFFEINDQYFLLQIAEEGLGGLELFNVLYNQNTKEVEYFDSFPTYYFENKLYFTGWTGSLLKAIYDLDKKELIDVSKKIHNKSHKWWVKKNNQKEFIVESWNGEKKFNLGKLPDIKYEQTGYADNIEFYFPYFETNQKNTYFAMLVKVEIFYENNNNLSFAQIIYGKLEQNGLEKAKILEVLYNDRAAGCWAIANQTLFLRDNLLITTSGCPQSLELTVFDLEKENFLYRFGEAKWHYNL